MPKLLETFDASEHEVRKTFDPLPAGWYSVVITGSDTFVTKGGTECLKLEMSVLDGEYADRRVFENLNLWHNKPDAVRIAQSQLASICTAIGKLRISDTEELHGHPFQIRVVTEETEKYGPQNRIRSYRALDPGHRDKVTPIRAATPAQAAPATGTKLPPWTQKRS